MHVRAEEKICEVFYYRSIYRWMNSSTINSSNSLHYRTLPVIYVDTLMHSDTDSLFGKLHRSSRWHFHSHRLFTRLRLIKFTDRQKYPSISPLLRSTSTAPGLCVCYSANALRFLLISCGTVATSRWFSHVWQQLAGASTAVRAVDGGSTHLHAFRVQRQLHWKLLSVFRCSTPHLLTS